MGNGTVQVPPDSTGKRIDGASLTSGAVSVIRQRVVLGDNVASAGFAQVVGSALHVTIGSFRDASGNVVQIVDSANICLKVRQTFALPAGTNHMGQVSVTGSVAISTIPNVNISAMPSVILAAGVANIGSINNISATVVVAGSVSIAGTATVTGVVTLGAGAANIGTVNNISAAVVLAAGAANIGTINNISAAVVLAAGAAHVGEVNVSLMPAVVLAAGANNIGTIQAISAGVTSVRVRNTSASATFANHTIQYAWGDQNGRQVTINNHPALVSAATHGPIAKDFSTVAATVLVASAGAACIYVTSLLLTNGSATQTKATVFDSASSAAPQVGAYLAANGGGFQQKFDPPWKLSAGTALQVNQTTGGLSCMATVHFYVGPA